MSDQTSLIVGISVLLIYVALMGIGIAGYIMTSISFYTIAKRRNINNPFLAWIPIASSWTVGCIANRHDEKMGYSKNWQKVLLTLGIIFSVGLIITYTVLIVKILELSMGYIYAEELDWAGILIAYIALIIISVVGMAWTFCHTICVYEVFDLIVPEKSIKYILLYLMVPLAGAICLMKIRKNDDACFHCENNIVLSKNNYNDETVEDEGGIVAYSVCVYDMQTHTMQRELRNIDTSKFPASKYAFNNTYYAIETIKDNKKVRIFYTKSNWDKQIENSVDEQ